MNTRRRRDRSEPCPALLCLAGSAGGCASDCLVAMAPKSSKEEKARAQAAAKKIEDKTFGMKNKNK